MIVSATWKENYGDANESISGGFRNALEAVKKDQKIQIVGLVQSLFEGSMYIFVFLWTPALQNAQDLVRQVEIPHGKETTPKPSSYQEGAFLMTFDPLAA